MKPGSLNDQTYDPLPIIKVGGLYELRSDCTRSVMARAFKTENGEWHFSNTAAFPFERGSIVLPVESTGSQWQICLYGEGFVAVSKRDLQEVEV